MKLIKPLVDNLVILFEQVTTKQFEKIRSYIAYCETHGLCEETYTRIGKGKSEYHYQLKIGKGSGAIHIGYKHNTCQPFKHRFEDDYAYTMRVEFNPSKRTSQHPFFDVVQASCKWGSKLITKIDFAFDIPVPLQQVMVEPLTGRTENRIKGTRYYGERQEDGHLKVYDKKKERKDNANVDIEGELTRIEYSVKYDQGLNYSQLLSSAIEPEYYYRVTLFKDDSKEISPEIMSCVYAIRDGRFQLKDFTRTNRLKIKNALQQCGELKLGECINNREFKKELIELIRTYTHDNLRGEYIAI